MAKSGITISSERSALVCLQRKMVELGMDVDFVWQQWDCRCQKVGQLQRNIDERMTDILGLMHSLPNPGEGFGSKKEWSLLMDYGILPALWPKYHCSSATIHLQT